MSGISANDGVWLSKLSGAGGGTLCGVAQRGKKFEIQGVENGNCRYTDITFWRPKIGTFIKRRDEESLGSTSSETIQKTTQMTTQKTA